MTLDEKGEVVVPPRSADGEILDTSEMNFTGFVIHSGIYNQREDVNCIMHSHPPAGLAVSALKEGFIPVVQDAFQFYNRVSYHEYEGLSLDLGERDRLAANLGDNPVMIMRNHGLLTVGSSVAQAYVRMHYFELSWPSTAGRPFPQEERFTCRQKKFASMLRFSIRNPHRLGLTNGQP